MSVIQSTQPELRYTKRQNLENEARVVGNYYRDLIRSYGVDCIYHKIDTTDFSNFKNIVDRNAILKHAYGYDINPDYSLSAHTLTYMEVENDIFQLNKFGLNPNADVNFYFENNDFACALATKAGQYKEYPIKEREIECEVPECVNDFEEFEEDVDPITKIHNKHYLSSNIFPYSLGFGYNEYYQCDELSGKLHVEIDGYEIGKSTTIICNPYEHTDFSINFDSNSDLYQSIKHVIENDDYLETMIYLTYTVNKVVVGKELVKLEELSFNEMHTVFSLKNALRKINNYLKYKNNLKLPAIDFDNMNSLLQLHNAINEYEKIINIPITSKQYNIEILRNSIIKIYSKIKAYNLTKDKCKFILSGKIYGKVLFFDINSLNKYAEKIHPSVGDIVTIDFPDETNRERYEITDCFDKQLTQDGISPLLHKYIWKCKARRFVDSFNDIQENDADERLQEKKEYEQRITEEVAKEISFYDDKQDSAYGGYEFDPATAKNYDRQDLRNIEHIKYDGLPENQLIDIQLFDCGSKLCTDGYSLIFITKNDEAFSVTTVNKELVVKDAVFECGQKWIKATRNQIVFVNIEGESSVLAFNENNGYQEEINIEDPNASTMNIQELNSKSVSFIKFNGCRTYMFANETQLFAKLEGNKSVYQII